MKGRFVIRDGNQLFIYNNSEDIPQVFDNLIEFIPDYPPPPHTEEQHEYINTFGPKLNELLKRERSNARNN